MYKIYTILLLFIIYNIMHYQHWMIILPLNLLFCFIISNISTKVISGFYPTQHPGDIFEMQICVNMGMYVAILEFL